MESKQGAKVQALPLKDFPSPKCSMGTWMLCPVLGTAMVFHPRKAKGASSELVPAQHRHTTRELLNLLIKLHFSVGDQGFTG